MSSNAPLGGSTPLIDAHAHFYHENAGRSDWARVNAARFRAGDAIGVTYHVASVLGSYGHTSPTYFPSPDDVTRGNDAMAAIAAAEPRARALVRDGESESHRACARRDRARRGARRHRREAARQSSRRRSAARSDLRAGRASSGCPCCITSGSIARASGRIQEISDGRDLARLAERHPRVAFILAHLGGGGDWAHTLPAVRDTPNVYPDLSGSGVDRGMLDAALDALGAQRLLWACDLTMETGLAKLRALEVIGLRPDDMADVRWRNAARLFPRGAFPRCERANDRSTARRTSASIRFVICRIPSPTCSCACSSARG